MDRYLGDGQMIIKKDLMTMHAFSLLKHLIQRIGDCTEVNLQVLPVILIMKAPNIE